MVRCCSMAPWIRYDLGRQAGLVPGGEVDSIWAPPITSPPVPAEQLLHQLRVAPGAADAVQAPEPRQMACISGSVEHSAVSPVAPMMEMPPPAPWAVAMGMPAGTMTRCPLDGPPGHLELFRQLRGSDLLPLEQDGQDADEPVHFHAGLSFPLYPCIYNTGTRQLSVHVSFFSCPFRGFWVQ
jgi:hypothetical protein